MMRICGRPLAEEAVENRDELAQRYMRRRTASEPSSLGSPDRRGSPGQRATP